MKFVHVILIIALSFGALEAPTQARDTHSREEAGAQIVSGCGQFLAAKHTGRTMKQVIAVAQRRDAKGLKRRVAQLRKSAALTYVIKHGGSTKSISAKKVTFYLTYLASFNTMKQAKHLVKVTKGKHFVVTGNAAIPHVTLAANPSTSPTSVNTADIKCWQGWVGYWAWWLGSEMTCTAFGALTGVALTPTGAGPVIGIAAGLACSGLFAYLSEKYIDFNQACGGAGTVSVRVSRETWGLE